MVLILIKGRRDLFGEPAVMLTILRVGDGSLFSMDMRSSIPAGESEVIQKGKRVYL